MSLPGLRPPTGKAGRARPAVAKTLDLVFKEVSSGKKRIPVQFMYSNVVHGAEGPIKHPHT